MLQLKSVISRDVAILWLWWERGVVIDRDDILIDLVKLTNGERLLRFTEPISGLSLEQKLVADQPVARQKERLFGVVAAALAEAELHPA
jgi:hypothetical protein